MTLDEICYVGDDVIDLPAMREVGFAVAVANAREQVKAEAHYVTPQRRRLRRGARCGRVHPRSQGHARPVHRSLHRRAQSDSAVDGYWQRGGADSSEVARSSSYAKTANRAVGNRRNVRVCLSGGLDSATVLAIAKAEGYELYALSFSYGQRHAWELEAAKRVAASIGVAAASHRGHRSARLRRLRAHRRHRRSQGPRNRKR